MEGKHFHRIHITSEVLKDLPGKVSDSSLIAGLYTHFVVPLTED